MDKNMPGKFKWWGDLIRRHCAALCANGVKKRRRNGERVGGLKMIG